MILSVKAMQRLPHLLLWSYLIAPLPIGMMLGQGQDRIDELALFNAAASLLWACLLSSVVRRPLHLHLLLLPFYLTAAADLFLLLVFGNRLSSAYVGIALSDHGELAEFSSFYATSIATILFPSILWVGAGFFLLRKQRSSVSVNRALLFGLLLLTLYGLAFTRNALSGMEARRNLLDISSKELSSPFGVVFQTGLALQIQREYAALSQVRSAMHVRATTNRPGAGEVFVLVVGESSRPQNWEIFGYDKRTNPQLANSKEFVRLPDFTTAAPHTSVAVPAMLSLRSVSDWSGVMSSPSIVNVFQAAGFQTRWLSTQEADSWGGHIPLLAREAERSVYFDRAFDGIMLKEFDAVLTASKADAKLFIVVHTKGSHWQYKRRYPAEFKIFGKDAVNKIDQVVAEYDNSIIYTDWFLSELQRRLKATGRPAFMLYASDHGENLNDGGSGLYGHAIGNKYDLTAAALYWMSDGLAARTGSAREMGVRHAVMPVSAANISHSMLGLAGIEAEGSSPALNIFSPSFAPGPRPYLVRGTFHADVVDALK